MGVKSKSAYSTRRTAGSSSFSGAKSKRSRLTNMKAAAGGRVKARKRG